MAVSEAGCQEFGGEEGNSPTICQKAQDFFPAIFVEEEQEK